MTDDASFFVKVDSVEINEMFTGWIVKISASDSFRKYAFSSPPEALKFIETVLSCK